MGAGASIDDEDDMKKQYEKQKADGTLTADQAQKLQEEYDALKATKKGNNEFLVIGKMNKAYDGVVKAGGGGDGAAKAAPAPAPAPAPAKPYPVPPEGFTTKAGPNPMVCVKMTEVEKAIDDARAANLTPLIIDRSESHAYDTFCGYSASIFDAKMMALEVAVQKKPVEEVMDKQRKVICAGIKFGKRIAIACQTSAPDFVGKFNDEKCEVDLSGKPFGNAQTATSKSLFPLELFDDSGKIFGTNMGKAEMLFRDDDVADSQNFVRQVDTFNIIVTTQFNYEDIDDFLFKDGSPALPPGKFQAIWLAHEEGTRAMD